MNVPLWRHPDFGAGRGIVHGFTGRHGVQPGSTLNLAHSTADAALRRDWDAALAAIDPSLSTDRLAVVHQVHGDRVIVVDEGRGPTHLLGDADGIVTTTPGVAVAVRVADCVPVLLAAPCGVAAVHAGWRGVASNIAGGAVEVLCAEARCAPEEVHVVVGPHISQDAFEVGPEVVDAIAQTGVPSAIFAKPGRGDRAYVSLWAAVADQLRRAGVSRRLRVEGCTRSSGLFSYRFDGPRTGRQAGIIAWLG